MENKKLNKLEKAAIAWWKNKRPLEYTPKDHYLNPTINTVDNKEKALAHAVIMMLRCKRNRMV